MTPAPAASRLSGVGQAFESARTPADFLAVWLNHRLLSPLSQQIVDDYYRNFRGLKSPRMRHWYNRQLQEAEAILAEAPGMRVLEIGVGTGTEFLWWAMRGAQVTGIDAFPHCVRTTAERLDVLQAGIGRTLDCSVRTVPLLTFEDAEGYDLIWLEQTFHHLEPRAEVVARIASLLRPGGRVVLSEANALNPLLQLQLLRVRGLRMTMAVETDQGRVVWGNERVLSRGALARWFRGHGVEQESAAYYRVFPSHPVFEPLFGLERRLSSDWLAPLYSHYNFVGRKAGPAARRVQG